MNDKQPIINNKQEGEWLSTKIKMNSLNIEVEFYTSYYANVYYDC